MEEGHQLLHLAVRTDQAFGDIVRMAGRVPDPLEFRELVELSYQIVEAKRSAGGGGAGPGVDVLAEQGDLTRAVFRQFLRFSQQITKRARDFSSASVGDDAISAEFVAAFLHCQEGAGPRAATLGKSFELGVRRHV